MAGCLAVTKWCTKGQVSAETQRTPITPSPIFCEDHVIHAMLQHGKQELSHTAQLQTKAPHPHMALISPVQTGQACVQHRELGFP